MEAPPPYPGIVPDTAPYPPTSNAHGKLVNKLLDFNCLLRKQPKHHTCTTMINTLLLTLQPLFTKIITITQ